MIFSDFPAMFEKMRFTSLKQKYYEHQGGLLAMFLQDCYRLEEEQFQLQHVRSTPYDTTHGVHPLTVPLPAPFFACVRACVRACVCVCSGARRRSPSRPPACWTTWTCARC